MSKITTKDLNTLIDRINAVTGSPTQAYIKDASGRLICHIGHYYLESAYGGYNIARISNAGGGITSPIDHGYYTKRELHGQLTGYLAGLSHKETSHD